MAIGTRIFLAFSLTSASVNAVTAFALVAPLSRLSPGASHALLAVKRTKDDKALSNEEHNLSSNAVASQEFNGYPRNPMEVMQLEGVTKKVNGKDLIDKIPARREESGITNKHFVQRKGIFSPFVTFLRAIIGEKDLNKARGNIISMHSKVIKKFVDTSNTSVGKAAMAGLFTLADKNGDGALQVQEVKSALGSLGFSWLKEKQVRGIVERADKDKNGLLDYEEFTTEVPKTLKTNLVKLAKKNGGEMGLLS